MNDKETINIVVFKPSDELLEYSVKEFEKMISEEKARLSRDDPVFDVVNAYQRSDIVNTVKQMLHENLGYFMNTFAREMQDEDKEVIFAISDQKGKFLPEIETSILNYLPIDESERSAFMELLFQEFSSFAKTEKYQRTWGCLSFKNNMIVLKLSKKPKKQPSGRKRARVVRR